MFGHAERAGAAGLGAARGAGRRDVAEGVGALVAEGGGVGGAAAADRVHHQEDRARHQAIRAEDQRRLGRARRSAMR